MLAPLSNPLATEMLTISTPSPVSTINFAVPRCFDDIDLTGTVNSDTPAIKSRFGNSAKIVFNGTLSSNGIGRCAATTFLGKTSALFGTLPSIKPYFTVTSPPVSNQPSGTGIEMLQSPLSLPPHAVVLTSEVSLPRSS